MMNINIVCCKYELKIMIILYNGNEERRSRDRGRWVRRWRGIKINKDMVPT